MRRRHRRDRAQLDLGRLDTLLEETKAAVKELVEKVRSLPRVEHDGSSQCPFAEELYAKKEETEKSVQGLMILLRQYLGVVLKKIERCRRNIQVIEASTTALNNDEPRREFSDAEAEQAAEYNRFVGNRDAILEVLEFVDEAMEEASAKKFPGRIPRQWPYMPEALTPLPIITVDGESETHQSPLDRELSDLLSLGPLARP
jgi:hypothetical protein